MTDQLGQDRVAVPGAAEWRSVCRSHAVICFDAAGHVNMGQRSPAGRAGLHAGADRRQPHSDFCAPGFAATDEYRAFWETLRAGESGSGEYKRLGKDGRELWLRGTYSPVLGRGGAYRQRAGDRVRHGPS